MKLYNTVIKDLNNISEAMSNGQVSMEQRKYEELATEIMYDLNPNVIGVTN
ncbi:hypothetical protein [Metabacillus herbersteinensis]|uniref:hypothetical protein n=1 Tax=Metabacillus herbersteinensis TaxID=283816 RepID=UPI003671224D